MKYYLGIDTSNYTTSMAVVDEHDNILCDIRRILKVPQGERGLRQSEAFFQHCNNFPQMFEEISQQIDVNKLVRIAVSTQPRNIGKSYMPVFLAGVNYSKVLSTALDVEITECSHQEGHIYSGMVPIKLSPPFLALHLSGGTTDMLYVEQGKGHRLNIENISSSSDIHCGQFVDRLGVYMGLSFPSGQELDELSQKGETKLTIPSSVKDGVPSFSGPLTAALRLVDQGERKKDIALAAFKCIAKTVEKMIDSGIKKTGAESIMLVGGVASNSLVRNHIQKKSGVITYAAPINLSSDNAVGVSFMGKKELELKEKDF